MSSGGAAKYRNPLLYENKAFKENPKEYMNMMERVAWINQPSFRFPILTKKFTDYNKKRAKS